MDTEVLDKREKLRTLINKSPNNFYFALCNALWTLFKRKSNESLDINLDVKGNTIALKIKSRRAVLHVNGCAVILFK